ncbi:MAG TPA: Rrf2 family transcriptional regulator [Thermomicrobiales bacterium]|jgi:Rrf2 family protein|nr:Rrf2 family transcriptional regulator [Thermomicrobiales bacterium]
MRRDGKFSVALHVLAHLTEAGTRPTTSEAMATHLQTNPVVVRRAMAGLREAGIVASTKGHGGGWTLAQPPGDVTLRRIYEVLADPGELITDPEIGSHGCQIQAVVNDALDSYHAEAHALLMRRLGDYTLADLSRDVHRRVRPDARPPGLTDVPTG